MVGEDFLGDHVARYEPRDNTCTYDRRHRPFRRRSVFRRFVATGDRHHAGGNVRSAGAPEVATQHPDQLLEITAQRGVHPHLDAEIFKHCAARCLRHRQGSGPHQRLVDLGDRGVRSNVDVRERLNNRFEAGGMLGQPTCRGEVVLHNDRHHRGQYPCVGSGLHGQVNVGQLGSFGTPRVDHDHGPVRIVGDLFQDGAGVWQAVALPRVLAHEDSHLGVFEIGAREPAHHLGVNPELASLLLRQRVRLETRTHRPECGARISTAKMVALPATAVGEDRRPTVLVTHLGKPRGCFGDCCIPVDLFIRTVSAPTKWAR